MFSVKDLLIATKLAKFSNDMMDVLVNKIKNFGTVVALIYKPSDAEPHRILP